MADTNGADMNAETVAETGAESGTETKDKETKDMEVKETQKAGESPKKGDSKEGETEKGESSKEEPQASTEGKDGPEVDEEDKGPPTELEKKIIRQIEYYFGDINLAKDKFLQEEIKKDDGWVPLETMVKFNRLKALTMEYGVICTALKKSDSGLMEVAADKAHIRRNPHRPLPEDSEEQRTKMTKRTVYAKGFPLDTKLDEILEFFQGKGVTDNIIMRRNNKREFKGSVFVVFHTEEQAQAFIDEKEMKYGETDLIRYKKEDYYKMKKEEHKNLKGEDQKKKQEKIEQREKEAEEKMKSRMTKGSVLKLTGLPEGIKREDLKEFFGQYATVAWADFDQGDVEAKLRFNEEGSAKTVWEKAVEAGSDGKVMFKEKELEGYVLEGDEEIEHWKGILQRDKRGGYNRGRGGRFGGRGRGGGRNRRPEGKRKVFDEDGAPPPKQAKADD